MFNNYLFLGIIILTLAACGGGGSSKTSEGVPNPPPAKDPDPEPVSREDPMAWEANCLTEDVSTADSSIPLPTIPEGPMPAHNGNMMKEHMAALDLVNYQQATHVATVNGSWCDPAIWHNDQVPGSDARVVIPEGVKIVYGSISDADLKTLRVDGTLEFSTTKQSRLMVDTIFVDPRGFISIGTENEPLTAKGKVAIIFTDRGPIDVNWDPLLLSRGLIAHGKTRIHGEAKTTHVKVKENPGKGDNIIVLRETPKNWKAGDQLVVAGTFYSGWKWDQALGDERYFGTQDEVRTIEAINGNVITLSSPLEYDHYTPRSDLNTSVANYSRSVVFLTENASDLPVSQRGHVMFMHNDDVDVRFAEFRQLGRTDKSVPSFEVHNLNTTGPRSNIRGRYPFHFHRTGLTDARNPAVAIGNAVFESPGWGFVHHDSHANFYNNASFDTFGAGFVSETGNETGDWIRNIAIKAKGTKAFNPKLDVDVENYDIARTGEGFWFQSRMVRSFHNVAASVNHGFVYFHRGTGVINFPAQQYMLPEALGYGGLVAPDDVPIRTFDENESFASQVGLYIVKANPMQQHDVYTVLSNFTAWEVEAGAAAEYTSHYLFEKFDLIANTVEAYRDPIFGIELGNNSTDMVIREASISGFPEGIRLTKFHTEDQWFGKDQYVLIDNVIEGATTDYVDLDTSIDTFISVEELNVDQFLVDLNDGAQFEYLDPATTARSGVSYTGKKVDSIGESPLPGGGDELGTPVFDMIGHLEQEGYMQTPGGESYTIIEQYFSDRATGHIYKKALPTRLGAEVVAAMNNEGGPWSRAKLTGTLNLQSQPPVVTHDEALTAFEQDISVNVLKNDLDPDGDSLSVDGIIQPRHGVIFDDENGNITYRPNRGFSGSDLIRFWVSDGQGNFVESQLTIETTGN